MTKPLDGIPRASADDPDLLPRSNPMTSKTVVAVRWPSRPDVLRAIVLPLNASDKDITDDEKLILELEADNAKLKEALKGVNRQATLTGLFWIADIARDALKQED